MWAASKEAGGPRPAQTVRVDAEATVRLCLSTSYTRGPVWLYLPRVASVPRSRLRRNARRPFLLLIHCARLNALDRCVHGILATVTSSVQHEFGKQRIWPHAFAAFSASPTWLAFLQLSKAGTRLAVTLSTRQLIMSLFLYCSASQPIWILC